MTSVSLEDAIRAAGGPLNLLRSNNYGRFQFPMRSEYSNWRDEQRAWHETAVIFDQGHHMTDVTFRGPDALRLMSEVGVNTLAGFGKGRAKQFVACNAEGFVIGDAILFALEDDELSLVGPPAVSRWTEFQALHGGYDVTVSRDDPTPVNTERRFFRFQVQGPNAMKTVEAAAEGSVPDIARFAIGSFSIAGVEVRALNHSMTRMTGLEIFGPKEEESRVLKALLRAAGPFGARQSGAMAYSTTALESGWIGIQMPAIYTGESTKAYREWVDARSLEAVATVGGSFEPTSIEDYYLRPGDLGYGRLVKFDHDFIGREALEAVAGIPTRQKVWLKWDKADTMRVIASSMFDEADVRAKYLEAPYAVYSTFQADAVMVDDATVGMAFRTGYTVNAGTWFSLASIDATHAVQGNSVTLLWGEPPGATAKLTAEPHVQTAVRATVCTSPLV